MGQCLPRVQYCCSPPVGVGLCPLLHREESESADEEAAEGLRLAVDVGRGACGQKGPRAVKYLAHAPRRAQGQYRTVMPRGPSPVVRCRRRSSSAVLAPLAPRSRSSLSLLSPLSRSLSLSPCACVHASCEKRACTRTPTHAPIGKRDGMACDGMTRTTCTHASDARAHARTQRGMHDGMTWAQ